MYCHTEPVGFGAPCRPGGGAISGLAFYEGGSYPARYRGALFFADHTRNNIRVMLPNNEVPDPTKVEDFGTDIGAAVDLRTGPGGDLFYVDIFRGTVQRIYKGDPPAPTAPGPAATITTPRIGDIYSVNRTIRFSGGAAAADGTALPASSMRWDLIQRHCPTETSCHRHFVGSREGVATGSFVAPEHERPSQIEIGLTVTHQGRADTSTVILTELGAVRADARSDGVGTEAADDGDFLVEPTE